MEAMLSIWEQESMLAAPDFLLIGAGITGLNAAISIKEQQPRARVMVIHPGPWGSGASHRNAGFACLGSPTELLSDWETHGEEVMWSVVKMRWQGLQRLQDRVGADRMDLTWTGGAELFTPDDAAALEQVESRIADLNRGFKQITGQPAQFASRPLPADGFRDLLGQVDIAQEGRIHTGKMMKALRALALEKGVEILGGLTVERLESGARGWEIYTREGYRLSSPCVGLATNGFTPAFYAGPEVVPARNQVFLTQPVAGLPWDACLHVRQGYIYIRRVGDRILIGGGRYLDPQGETTDVEGTTEAIESFLHQFLHRHLEVPPDLIFSQAWSGTLGVGPVKMPIIQALDTNLYGGIRLGGMGVAIGTLVGETLGQKMMGL